MSEQAMCCGTNQEGVNQACCCNPEFYKCSIILLMVPFYKIILAITFSISAMLSKIADFNFYIWLVQEYQKYISKRLPTSCHFIPSCSQYSILAVQKYGYKDGLQLTINRLYRCKSNVVMGLLDEP